MDSVFIYLDWTEDLSFETFLLAVGIGLAFLAFFAFFFVIGYHLVKQGYLEKSLWKTFLGMLFLIVILGLLLLFLIRLFERQKEQSKKITTSTKTK